MGSFGIWHWMVILVIVLLLFGKGKVSELMGDLGRGVTSFKKGLAEPDSVASASVPTLTLNEGKATPSSDRDRSAKL